jgi:hypothetical protein
MEQVFTGIFQSNRRIGDESVSGPGSSLEQTIEIRPRLPLLLEDLKVRSLLHAGCADFHWMKDLALGVEEHIGVDIVQTTGRTKSTTPRWTQAQFPQVGYHERPSASSRLDSLSRLLSPLFFSSSLQCPQKLQKK